MTEPIRHEASARNSRKALQHAERLLEEMTFIHAEHLKQIVNLEYSMGRAQRLVNRLKAKP